MIKRFTIFVCYFSFSAHFTQLTHLTATAAFGIFFLLAIPFSQLLVSHLRRRVVVITGAHRNS